MEGEFSDYIVYADESGDHGLTNIDPQYPVFALIFCVIKKEDYIKKIVPAVQRFKFNFWGHEEVILHEHDIRKSKGCFKLLMTDPRLRKKFYNELNNLIENSPMEIFAAVINKEKLKEKYDNPWNPYEISLFFCMERLLKMLCSQDQAGKVTHVVFESRGNREDQNLEIEFRRICSNEGSWGWRER